MKEHITWLILMITITLVVGIMSAIVISEFWLTGLLMYLMILPIYFGTCPQGGYINP